VGQVSHLGTAFFVFGLVVLAALMVMGLITFERVLESSNTQFLYARGITRIRHLYLEYAPHMRPYFILSAHDDVEGTLMDMGVRKPSPSLMPLRILVIYSIRQVKSYAKKSCSLLCVRIYSKGGYASSSIGSRW
jgi:hypothetical protein